MEKLKRVMVKEELVHLTGDFKKAIVLNQMIYWSERRDDADKFIQEEMDRIERYATSEEELADLDIEKFKGHGWVYKSSEELAEETMLGVKSKAMRNYLKELVLKGWLDERKNPKVKIDRTYQYRVNLLKIQRDLNQLGFALEGYSLPDVSTNSPIFPQENSNGKKEKWKGEKEKPTVDKEKTIPEITTEITYKEDDDASVRGENPDDGILITDHDDKISSGESITPEAVEKAMEHEYLTRRGSGMFVGPKDVQSLFQIAKQLAAHNIPPAKASEWVKEAFDQYKPSYNGDRIRSFSYCATYIQRRLSSALKRRTVREKMDQPSRRQNSSSPAAESGKSIFDQLREEGEDGLRSGY